MPTLRKSLVRIISLPLLTLLPALAFAAEGDVDAGNTAWILTATALVLFMTVPGLSLFYAGLVALVVAVGFLGFGLIAGSGR